MHPYLGARICGQIEAICAAKRLVLGDFIGVALQLFEQKQELIVAKCEMEFFDPVKGYILLPEDPRHQAAVLSSSCGMLMRRGHFLRIGGFPEDLVFRGPSGGEDVAFMQAVMAHFQPIARIEQPGYRVWSRSGSHVDRFLANTRLTDAGFFEFLENYSMPVDAIKLANSIEEYLNAVQLSLESPVRLAIQ